MRYINQKGYPEIPYPTRTDHPEDEKGPNTTVATSGCGLCSAIMALDRLYPDRDYTFSVSDALQIALETGANHGVGTDGRRFFPAFAKKFDLQYAATNDQDAVRECLRNGGAAIALVEKGKEEGAVSVFTHSAHYVCLVSCLKDGRFAVLDPNLYVGKFEEPGRQGKAELHGSLALCTPEVLAADVLPVVERTEGKPDAAGTKAYHLFWRF